MALDRINATALLDGGVTSADLATQTGNVDFADNARIRLGDSQDLQIFHDGSNSWINEVGTGQLILAGEDVRITTPNAGEFMATFGVNGAATLYYDNAAKLATTATGADVAGTFTSDAISVVNNQSAHTNIDVFNNSGLSSAKGQLRVGYDSANCLEIFRVGNLPDINLNATQSGPIKFQQGGSEKMRLSNTGHLLVGITSSVTSGSEGVEIRGDYGYIKTGRNDTGSVGHMLFYNPNGNVGSITTTGSSTQYNTSSDYRLKENVTDITDATTRLKQLNPVRFNFIADADTTVDGFLAHEVQDIVPEAISGTKDGMRDEEYEVTPAVLDEIGNEVTPAVMGTRSVPDYQGIDQGKLVPLLVKSLQEALTKIDEQSLKIGELETRIASLEAN